MGPATPLGEAEERGPPLNGEALPVNMTVAAVRAGGDWDILLKLRARYFRYYFVQFFRVSLSFSIHESQKAQLLHNERAARVLSCNTLQDLSSP